MIRFVLGVLLLALMMGGAAVIAQTVGLPPITSGAPKETVELPPRPPSLSACAARLDCQQQRVLDLLDYRIYLEEELALAKALLLEARRSLVECQAALKACLAPDPHAR